MYWSISSVPSRFSWICTMAMSISATSWIGEPLRLKKWNNFKLWTKPSLCDSSHRDGLLYSFLSNSIQNSSNRMNVFMVQLKTKKFFIFLIKKKKTLISSLSEAFAIFPCSMVLLNSGRSSVGTLINLVGEYQDCSVSINRFKILTKTGKSIQRI